MQAPSSVDEENVFTQSANRYLDERERKWIEREKRWTGTARVQTLWNWTFAILFTIMLAVLALVAKSFNESNKLQCEAIEIQKQHGRELARSAEDLRTYLSEKKQQDARLAEEYRQNMITWKNEEGHNGKAEVVRK